MSWTYLALLHWEMEASLDGSRFFDFLAFGMPLFRVSHDYLIVLNFFGGIFGGIFRIPKLCGTQFFQFLEIFGKRQHACRRL